MTHARTRIAIGALILIAVGFSSSVSIADARSYHYAWITATIVVNKDSTIDIQEKENFVFVGNFHAGERDISLNKLSAVTDISVVDGVTGAPLAYSSSRLDPLAAGSAGKYAVWNENGFQKVEWYYDLADTTHEWIVKYKAHGALSFEKNDDRLYWNALQDYEVPIEHASVTVALPAAVAPADVLSAAYRSSDAPALHSFDGSTFSFAADNIAPGEAFTIDASWPIGLVDRGAFWRDLFAREWPAFLGWAIIAGCLLYGFFWWFFAVFLKERPGTVVPQYEPPKGLRPAIAEVIMHENIGARGLSATIVDLAVRGYLTIKEDPKPPLIVSILVAGVVVVPSVIFAAVFFWVFLGAALSNGGPGVQLFGLALVVVFVISLMAGSRRSFINKDYTITAKKDFAKDPALKQYEKDYLALLFAKGDGGKVSTKDLRGPQGIPPQEFADRMQKLKASIREDAEKETGAFLQFSGKWRNKKLIAVLVGALLASFIAGLVASSGGSQALPIVFAGGAVIALILFMKFVTRRSPEGKELRDEWLGFKMYLEVADRYRMQNLTPDLFEKYLPYAIIFGVEKKWARAFDTAGVQMGAPVWFAGPAGSVGAGSAQGFSASAFSASFSSSFASSFGGSAGGGGAGGGSAGGGGGGGGGGAR